MGDPRGPGRGPTLARGGRSANAAATAMAAAPAKAKAMGGGAAAGELTGSSPFLRQKKLDPAGGAGSGLLAMGVFPGFVPPNPFGSVPGSWYCSRCAQWFRGRHDMADHMRAHGIVWRRGPGRLGHWLMQLRQARGFRVAQATKHVR